MTDETAKQLQLLVPTSPMRVAPDHNAECSNECLYGERFVVAPLSVQTTPNTTESAHESYANEQLSQWVRVIAQRDSYTGYVEKSHLQAMDKDSILPTHWVCARSTLVFSEPSIKSRVLNRLPFLSNITSHDLVKSPFRALSTGGFVWHDHLIATNHTLNVSALHLARTHFLGAPYLWGGCTPAGVDCSGLIQALARAQGIDIPRDSCDQEKALNNNVAVGKLLAEDIVYWPGHTGILVDPDTLLHATAHSLDCVIEPLDKVVSRAGSISSIKRLFTS
ncbi:MAG: NlpC/P60 family protein [Granulosicoccus sp.]